MLKYYEVSGEIVKEYRKYPQAGGRQKRIKNIPQCRPEIVVRNVKKKVYEDVMSKGNFVDGAIKKRIYEGAKSTVILVDRDAICSFE